MNEEAKQITGNLVRKALLERKLTIGTWLQMGHPAIAEVFANAGSDWIAADCEHSDISIEAFTGIARGMYGRGSVPMARVKENNTLAIRQILDAGAKGVIVPLVNSAGEAKKAVAAAKYPPEGIRGFAFCRANNWGADFDRYIKTANEDVAVVVMIESRQAVENIDEILAVEGVDGVFVGPYDMSGSYGVTGQTSHPIIKDACRVVLEACKKHKKSAGIHIVVPTDKLIRSAVADGFTFIALGTDGVFLDKSARNAIQLARNAVK